MFCDWIKSLEKQGMKLYEISDIIGVTYQTVQSYRDKGIYPTVSNLIKLSEHFKISIDDMIFYPIKKNDNIIEDYNLLSERQKGEIDYHIKQLLEQQKNINAG